MAQTVDGVPCYLSDAPPGRHHQRGDLDPALLVVPDLVTVHLSEDWKDSRLPRELPER